LPIVDGRIPLPTKPGLGVTIDENALNTFRV
jgi:L-alanine-DL-glutamate epimerase-like enolase superfamily enzyme